MHEDGSGSRRASRRIFLRLFGYRSFGAGLAFPRYSAHSFHVMFTVCIVLAWVWGAGRVVLIVLQTQTAIVDAGCGATHLSRRAGFGI